MFKLCYFNDKPILYRAKHVFRSTNGDSSEKVITIYKSEESETMELVVQITDNTNLFILFVMKLSQKDFDKIRVSQELTSAFNTFPDELISLLELTVPEDSKVHLHSKIDSSSLTLSICEQSTMKQVTHLTLKFQRGSDEEVEEKIILHIKNLEKQLNTKKQACKELQKLSWSLEKNLQIKENEALSLMGVLKKQQEDIQSQLIAQLVALDLNNQQVLQDLQNKYFEQLEANDTKAKHEKDIIAAINQQLEADINTLKKENDVLRARLTETATNLSTACEKYKKIEKDLQTVSINLEISKDDINKKQNQNIYLAKQVEQLKHRICNLESDNFHLQTCLDEKTKKLERITEMLNQTEVKYHNLYLKLQQAENQCQNSSRNAMNTRQVATDLQSELNKALMLQKEWKQQVIELSDKETNYITQVQKLEDKISDCEKKLAKFQTEIEENNIQLKLLKAEKMCLQDKLNSATKELSEFKQGIACHPPLPLKNDGANMSSYYNKKFLQK